MKYDNINKSSILFILIININLALWFAQRIKENRSIGVLIEKNLQRDKRKEKARDKIFENQRINESEKFIDYEIMETRRILDNIKLINSTIWSERRTDNPKLLLELDFEDNYTELILSIPEDKNKNLKSHVIDELIDDTYINIKRNNFALIKKILPKFLSNALKQLNLTDKMFNIQTDFYKINNSNKTKIMSLSFVYSRKNFLKNDILVQPQYANNFNKFKSISNKIILNRDEIDKTNLNLLQKINIQKIIDNPCYLKGYYHSSNMKGTGDYKKCYEMLSKIVTKSEGNKFGSLKNHNMKNEKSIILGSDFKEISDFLIVQNITFAQLKEKALQICSEDYKTFQTIYNNTNYDNMCLKLTYTVILFDKLFNVDDYFILILASNLNDYKTLREKEDSLILNLTFIKLNTVPKLLLISLMFTFFIFIVSYLLKSPISSLIENLYFRDQIDVHEVNFKLLDTTINTLPVKNFIFTNLINEVRQYTQKEIFISPSEYKLFYYKMFQRHVGLRNIVNETLILRNKLNVSILISVFQISLAIMLSILTTKTISHLSFENKKYFSYFLIFFSFMYMSILTYECLRLITFIDNKKYLYSDKLTQYDKKFLEDEFEDTGTNFMEC